MKTKFKFFITASFLGLILLINGCNKKTDCAVNIKCKDSNGTYLNKAKVELFADVQNGNKSTFRADMRAEGLSDNSGEAIFIFKLPAIYDVMVTSGTKTATCIVKLEEGKTVTKEVIVN